MAIMQESVTTTTTTVQACDTAIIRSTPMLNFPSIEAPSAQVPALSDEWLYAIGEVILFSFLFLDSICHLTFQKEVWVVILQE